MFDRLPPHTERWQRISGVVFLLVLAAGLIVLHPITVESTAENLEAIGVGALIGLGLVVLDRRSDSHRAPPRRRFLAAFATVVAVMIAENVVPVMADHAVLGTILVVAPASLLDIPEFAEDGSPDPAS